MATPSSFPRETADASGTTTVRARSRSVQRRGRQRVQLLLEAADSLLAEEGYHAATLKAIGHRAGIPTASVYHYFADREEIDAELLRGHLQHLDAEVAAALEGARPGCLSDAVSSAVEALHRCYRESPSFVQLWFVGRTPRLGEHAHGHDRMQARRLWCFLKERGLLRGDTPQLVVEVAVEACDRLFDRAFRACSTGDEAVVAEAHRLVTAYLETYSPGQRGP